MCVFTDTFDSDITELLKALEKTGTEQAKRPTFIETSQTEWDIIRDRIHKRFAEGMAVKHYHSLGV
jgi:hypothetical protein